MQFYGEKSEQPVSVGIEIGVRGGIGEKVIEWPPDNLVLSVLLFVLA